MERAGQPSHPQMNSKVNLIQTLLDVGFEVGSLDFIFAFQRPIASIFYIDYELLSGFSINRNVAQ
jgi:hypothetical protein